MTYASQLHIAVVEIDRDTFDSQGFSTMLRWTTAARSSTPPIVEGQVYGATAHGIGAALMENLRVRRRREHADQHLQRLHPDHRR